MPATRKFVKKMQDYLKGDEGMTPYMFPMIGKNYEKANKKVLVVYGYILQDNFIEKLLKTIDKNVSQEEICVKDDIIRHAWENMIIDGSHKRTPQNVLKKECEKYGYNIDDIIFTSYSRYPSKEKYVWVDNDHNVPVHRFPEWIAAINFLINLVNCTEPDEVWFLGPDTERIVFCIPKNEHKIDKEWISSQNVVNFLFGIPGKSDDDLLENPNPESDAQKKHGKRKNYNKIIAELTEERRRIFPNYKLIPLRKKSQTKAQNKKVSDNLDKKFYKIIQGNDFAKLSIKSQKDWLSSLINHIQKKLKQLDE